MRTRSKLRTANKTIKSFPPQIITTDNKLEIPVYELLIIKKTESKQCRKETF